MVDMDTERREQIRRKKAEACLARTQSGWQNGVEEAAERLTDHALNFDARDISAFRYLVNLARNHEIARRSKALSDNAKASSKDRQVLLLSRTLLS